MPLKSNCNHIVFIMEGKQKKNTFRFENTSLRFTIVEHIVLRIILINDLNTMGLFFETLCVRDLRVFADALDGEVYHYRDKNGLECDAVVHLRNGKYGLVEVKLGGDKLINEGAANLLTLAGKINTEKMNEPSFMMVLTGTGDFAYRRKDGVFVVPIGCLKD